MVSSIKTAVSLPRSTAAGLDNLARRRHTSRSAIVATAVDAYLERADAEDFLQSLNDAYGDEPLADEDREFLNRAARDLARVITEEDGPWPTG